MTNNRIHHSHSMSLGSNNIRRTRNGSNSSSNNSSSTDITFGHNVVTMGGLGAQHFPTMPPSPTTLETNGWGSHGSPMISPSTQPCTSSRINLAGSWLDLGSDSEDEYGTSNRLYSGGLSLRNRRKGSSLSSSKDAAKNPLSNLKELTRRSSMHFRKLTNRSLGGGSSS